MTKKLKLAVLGSGSGSNFLSIAEAIKLKKLDAEITIVVSDVEDALILKRAEKFNIKSKYISGAPFKTKIEGEAENNYIQTIKKSGADYVILAGFMRIIKPKLLKAFSGKIINIHPSLLPAFPGIHSWEQALEYGAKFTGCTVHFVDEGTDTGPIILQKVVPILDDDTAQTLHQRIQVQEHIAFPEAIQLIAEDKLKFATERRIVIQNINGEEKNIYE
jgi:phosphoribosylglycinamide formyltransferase 1